MAGDTLDGSTRPLEGSSADVFALKNSGLDAFLYADVGTELNGAPLTILSVLARLGRDPWAEAARWARLPRTGAIESLAQSMAQMPLMPSALAETHSTAARLVKLLPGAAPGALPGSTAKPDTASMPEWLPVTLLYCAVAVVMAIGALNMPRPSQAVSPQTERPAAMQHGLVASPPE